MAAGSADRRSDADARDHQQRNSQQEPEDRAGEPAARPGVPIPRAIEILLLTVSSVFAIVPTRVGHGILPAMMTIFAIVRLLTSLNGAARGGVPAETGNRAR